MPDQLSVRVNATAPGEKATLDIMRDGKPMTRQRHDRLCEHATVAKNGDAAQRRIASRHAAASADAGGAQLRRAVSGGLVVEESSGRAAEAGIQQGDVVLSVNGTPVNSVDAAAQSRPRAWQSGGAADSARRHPHFRAGRPGLSAPPISHVPVRGPACSRQDSRPAVFSL